MMSPLPDDPLPSPKHMTKASSDSEQEVVQSSSKEKIKREHPKHSNSSVQLSSDEEQDLMELEKPRKHSKPKHRPKTVKPASERKENKSRNSIIDDSDSDNNSSYNNKKSEKWKLQQRSHSASPIKPKKQSSRQSTPRHRPPSSTRSTPVREKKFEKESPKKDARKTPQSSNKKLNRNLSERSGSEDTEDEVLPPSKSPRTAPPQVASQKKQSALASI